MKGCDYAWERPSMQALTDAGITFACRYLGYDTTGKNLTQAEARELHGAGLGIVLNFEYDPDSPLRGRTQGVADATISKAQRSALGAPDTVPIYFSVDFDATADQLAGLVADYFQGVATVLPVPQIGVYGSYRTVGTLMASGLVTYGWQTYAWSGGQWAHPHIRQVQNDVTVGGVKIDIDESMVANYGQWLPANTQGGIVAADYGFTEPEHGDALAWRVAAMAQGTDTAVGGPAQGEAVWIVQELKAISAKLDELLARPAGSVTVAGGAISLSGSMSGSLTPAPPTVPSGQ